MARDFNDVAREGGPEAVRAEWDRVPQPRVLANGNAAESDEDGPRHRQANLLSSAAFVKGFLPPDYLVDGVLQRRFCYSFTGATGAGKTAVALLLAYCVAAGTKFGDHEVSSGKVIYFAAENADDVRMRWIAMSATLGFDLGKIDVHFVPGTDKISEIDPSLRLKIEELGGAVLVIIDTSSALYETDEENSNTQMGGHARRLRGLTSTAGGPAVVVLCHPTKNAVADNLAPRGGGAFVAEMDGNLTATKKEDASEVHWQIKYRGVDFAPMTFRLDTIRTDRLVDSRGRHIPSVIAAAVTEAEQADLEKRARRDEDVLLLAMKAHPGGSLASIADAAGWRLRNAKPDKMKVKRVALLLKKDKLTEQKRGTWHLTKQGTKEAEKAKLDSDLAGARY